MILLPHSSWTIWIQAARPRTLPATAAPVLIGTAMATAAGDFNLLVCAATFFAAAMIQVGTNYANDYYDYLKGTDTQDRLGPVRATQAGLVTPSAMRNAFIIAFALAVAAGAYLVFVGGVPIVIIGLVSVACGILYTAGPWPLGYIGLADLFVVVFFGPVAVGGTYYLQTGEIGLPVILAGLAPGLLSTALLTVNNIRDWATDKRAGKKSLVVRFGTGFGNAEYTLCVLIACVIPAFLFLFLDGKAGAIAALLTLAFAAGPLNTLHRQPDAATFNRLLEQTGRLLLIFSVLFSIGWLL